MASYLLYVLSRPYGVSSETWEKFYADEHLDDLVRHGVATKGSFYAHVSNPMGRTSPDSNTHLVLFDTIHPKPFESAGFKEVTNTSSLFPPGAGTKDLSDLECRHYELLEVFDGGKGVKTTSPADFILQTEISVSNIDDFRRYYREDHIPMLAKHTGFRRSIMYRYMQTTVVYNVTPAPDPGSIIVLHEFDHFDGLSGPVTKAALQTDYAVAMRSQIKKMQARALKLVCTDSSQR